MPGEPQEFRGRYRQLTHKKTVDEDAISARGTNGRQRAVRGSMLGVMHMQRVGKGGGGAGGGPPLLLIFLLMWTL